MITPSLARSPALATLNDDEIKRIMSVLERDFKLRHKEWKRIGELKRIIRQEKEQMERFIASKEWHGQRCSRCSKPFRRFFNPKERCSTCRQWVCHACAIWSKQTKTWTCKACERLKELECLTSQWFYQEIAKKFKRCGSAKIVRDLCKREKELAEIAEKEEDLGYGTLTSRRRNNSNSIGSYVIHDRSIRSELCEYGKRLTLLIDSLKADASDGNDNDQRRSIRDKESLKIHQHQISAEIHRAQIDLSGALRRSNTKLNQTYDEDLRGLLIQETEEVLQMNLPPTEKTTLVQSSNFDQELAQIIFDKYAHTIDSPLIPSKLQSQTAPSTPNTTSSHSTNLSEDKATAKTTFPNAPADSEEDDDDDDITLTESSVGDDKSDSPVSKHRFIDTDLETINKSSQRVDDWQTSFAGVETESTPSSDDDDDAQVEFSTWL